MKFKNLYLGLAAFALLFTSCSNDDDTTIDIPSGAYIDGVFILNEGNFGTPNASVSFLSNDLVTFQNAIFSTMNPTETLGDVAQSMSFYNDKAFIVVNNSNEVRVVDRYSFKNVATITTNLENPRYSVVYNGFLYVTNAISEAVTVYNASTYAYVRTIEVGKTSERIVESNGKLYVMNGGYGSGNEVSVIDLGTNKVSKVITVEEGINSIEASNGSVYVLCGNDTRTKLFKINAATDVATSFETTTLTNSINMDIDGSKIYYTSGTGIYVMDLTATTFTDTPLFNVTANSWSTLYGFAAIDGKIYTADAAGFINDGKVVVYSATGEALKTVEVGMGPNGFYANN